MDLPRALLRPRPNPEAIRGSTVPETLHMEPDVKPDTSSIHPGHATLRSVQVSKEATLVPTLAGNQDKGVGVTEKGDEDKKSKASPPKADANKEHEKLDKAILMAKEINDMMKSEEEAGAGVDKLPEPQKQPPKATKSKAKAAPTSPSTLKEMKLMLSSLRMLFSLRFGSLLFFILFTQIDRVLTPDTFPKRVMLLLLFSFAFPPIIPDLVLYTFEPPIEKWKKATENIWVQDGLCAKKHE